MNIYEKLGKIRLELSQANLKKSGKNTFSKYEYYELGDFLPTVTKLCEKQKVLPVVSFTQDVAKLTLYDADADSGMHSAPIEFTSPMGKAELKGCHDVQNIGAVETYQRRYLYMTAFEVVESDVLDENTGRADGVGDTARKAAQPKQQANPKEQPIICPVCGDEIRPQTIKGVERTAKEQYAKMKMCADCYRTLKEADKENAEG